MLSARRLFSALTVFLSLSFLTALPFGIKKAAAALSTRALSMSSLKRGAFILLEGIDRCGKSTQAAKLTELLQTGAGQAEFIRFPNRTSAIGQMINAYLQSATNMNDQTIHLLFSANRWEAAQDIEAKLAQGVTLVCDRYAYSGVAFSSAKGLDIGWCKSGDVGLPAPDCVIYLDMPVEEAAQRGAYGEERYEKVDFQLKVREKFMALRAEDEGRVPWYTLDARRTVEDLQAEIATIAALTAGECGAKAIERLWAEE